jgi:CHAD domain-containing protein
MPDGLEAVQKALRELNKSLKGLPKHPLPKQVHKLRTSARRVEAIAAAVPRAKKKKSRRLVQSIEPLRKAAGSVRDMDVLEANLRKLSRESAGDSLARLIDHLQSVRASSAKDLYRAFERKRKAARHKLKKFARQVQAAWPSNGASAHAAVQPAHARNGKHGNGANPTAKHLASALAGWPPLDEQDIHEFRVKIKELRYILQLDAKSDPDFVAALGSAQRLIGEWHDWQQLAEMAQEFLEPEQDQQLLARIDETKQKKFMRALTAANALRRQYLTSTIPHIPGC